MHVYWCLSPVVVRLTLIIQCTPANKGIPCPRVYAQAANNLGASVHIDVGLTYEIPSHTDSTTTRPRTTSHSCINVTGMLNTTNIYKNKIVAIHGSIRVQDWTAGHPEYNNLPLDLRPIAHNLEAHNIPMALKHNL